MLTLEMLLAHTTWLNISHWMQIILHLKYISHPHRPNHHHMMIFYYFFCLICSQTIAVGTGIYHALKPPPSAAPDPESPPYSDNIHIVFF